MEALDRASANVRSLLVVITALIRFDHNVPCKFPGVRTSILGEVSIGGWQQYGWTPVRIPIGCQQ